MLVDTSVWIDHLRRRSARLSDLLEGTRVWTHPFVIGELACGNLSRRGEVLGLLNALPRAPLVEHLDVMEFAGAQQLQGRGLGWIDLHLLASARLSGLPLWTLDRRLSALARVLAPGSAGD